MLLSKLLALVPLLLVALLAASCTAAPEASGDLIEVHRSPDCSCCKEYEEYLASEGFRVRTVLHPEGLDAFKEQAGVPEGLGSCHTSSIGGYFVEGHVSAAQIRRLLDEAPDISGIALPGMPPGSPGMGGRATGPLVVYAVDGDEIRVFGEG